MHPSPSSKSLGQIKLTNIFYFYLSLILFAPAYSYYMAVSQKQQHPFPHASVTATACHYPQAIVFRWIMITAASFLSLIFHTIFRWYQKQAIKYQYPGSVYSYMYWPTILSVIGYLAAIATIDTQGTGLIHAIGAGYFFMFLYFMVVNFTIISYKMRQWDTRTMSKASLTAKMIVMIYLHLVYVYCFVGLLNQVWPGHSKNDDNKWGVIVEWNLVYGGLVWVLCFIADFKNIYLVLNNKNIPNSQYDSQIQTIVI